MAEETVHEMFEKDSVLVDLLATLKTRVERITQNWANGEITDRAMVLELVSIQRDLNHGIAMAGEKHLAWFNAKKALKDILESQKRETTDAG